MMVKLKIHEFRFVLLKKKKVQELVVSFSGIINKQSQKMIVKLRMINNTRG